MPPPPSVDIVNPFNFVAFPERDPAPASGPAAAAHVRWRANRLSGVIEVVFRAVTPIFVPAGTPEKQASQPRPFWSCLRAGADEPVHGLPGSSVKGAFSTLFEAFTRSRLRVFDPSRFKRKVRIGKKKKAKADELADPWRPRELLRLEEASTDTAEATLGFISADEPGHAFRGRLRFETFWVESKPCEPSPLRLQPLLSQERADLYLDRSVNPVRYRGRKIYWHQRWSDDFPPQHRGKGDDLDAEVQPLPADTVFAGRVHFDNLTRAELGAVLVCLCPDLFRCGDTDTVGFDQAREYGLKIGAGKPRGLGSVRPQIRSLQLCCAAPNAYASLGAPLLRSETDLCSYVDAFRKTFGSSTPPFVRDLERLLGLPNADFVCQYTRLRDLPLAREAGIP